MYVPQRLKLRTQFVVGFAPHVIWPRQMTIPFANCTTKPGAITARTCQCAGCRRSVRRTKLRTCATKRLARNRQLNYVILQKLVVRGFYTGLGYAPFVAAAELALKVRTAGSTRQHLQVVAEFCSNVQVNFEMLDEEVSHKLLFRRQW